MKILPPRLAAYLLSVRQSADADVNIADCFRLTLMIGEEIRITSADVDITIDGETFYANSIMVKGLRTRASIGLDADQQQIEILYGQDDLIGGIPYAAAIANGLLNFCKIERIRAYFSDYVGGDHLGSVVVFRGRVTSVESAGAFTAQVTVANSLVVLENDMPRNTYGPPCSHILYDTGCGLNRDDFMVETTATAGTDGHYIYTADADSKMIGGYAEFVTGACTGVRAIIKNVQHHVSVELLLIAPSVPEAGDVVRLFQGCDHTPTTCKNKFNNLAHFRGYPYVPAPQFAQ